MHTKNKEYPYLELNGVLYLRDVIECINEDIFVWYTEVRPVGHTRMLI